MAEAAKGSESVLRGESFAGAARAEKEAGEREVPTLNPELGDEEGAPDDRSVLQRVADAIKGDSRLDYADQNQGKSV